MNQKRGVNVMFNTRTKNEIADVLNFLTGFDTDAMSKNRKEEYSQLLINGIEELKRRRLDDKKRSN